MGALRRYLFLPCLLLLLSMADSSAIEEHTSDPTVTIASGVIIGTATGVINQPTNTGLVNAYLGVPFAQSPPLRFAPPTAPKAWSSPLRAQTLPPACLQQIPNDAPGRAANKFFNNPGGPAPAESEDCLYLNVFAPQDAGPSSLRPVLFWIFGGGNNFGTASLALYNGSSLAVNEDVIVVAGNSRTNIFGFSNSPEIPFGQQNSGFLDVRYALQWVQSNIKPFGGDPSKVTIFGESTGGYLVKQLLADPPSPLPFRAAVMESQSASTSNNGTGHYNQVLSNFGCASAPSPIACLRDIAGTDIQSYIVEQGITFSPVTNDGTDVVSDALPSIRSGQFADVPILIGTNKDEGRIFLAMAGLDNGTSLVDGVRALTGFDISPIEPQILATYSTSITNSPYLLLSQVITDLAFTCTTQKLSDAIQVAGRQPVWRYRYDGVFPGAAMFNDPGAYHSAEISEVWGTYALSNAYGEATATQIALSKYMQGIWAGFAKDPVNGIPWAKLGTNYSFELALLGGSGNPVGGQTVSLAMADYPCIIYDQLLTAGNNSY